MKKSKKEIIEERKIAWKKRLKEAATFFDENDRQKIAEKYIKRKAELKDLKHQTKIERKAELKKRRAELKKLKEIERQDRFKLGIQADIERQKRKIEISQQELPIMGDPYQFTKIQQKGRCLSCGKSVIPGNERCYSCS